MASSLFPYLLATRTNDANYESRSIISTYYILLLIMESRTAHSPVIRHAHMWHVAYYLSFFCAGLT